MQTSRQCIPLPCSVVFCLPVHALHKPVHAWGCLEAALHALLYPSIPCGLTCLQRWLVLQVDEPVYFVDFLRDPIVDDETGEVLDAHPSNYEAVPGGLPEIRARVEALQRRFNEESKVL